MELEDKYFKKQSLFFRFGIKMHRKWEEFFKEKNVGQEQIALYLDYIKNLLNQNLPIVFEQTHLSRLFGIDKQELRLYINHSESAYRTFTIPKRRGGTREILSPYPILAHCQRWILDHILNKVSLSEHCYSFRPDRTIKDNAEVHLGEKEILKIDITDFFGSIKINRIISLFQRLGYTYKLSVYFATLCCYKGYLPQGASTSPMLSNIIGGVLDIRLSALAKKFNLKYSRYADDITFSGEEIPPKLIAYSYDIIRNESFEPNQKKTMHKTEGQRKIVTGVCITAGDKVRVPKPYRRQFRQEVHFLLKNGIKEYNGEIGKFDPLYVDRLIGKAQFILNIEPDYEYAKSVLPRLIAMKLL